MFVRKKNIFPSEEEKRPDPLTWQTEEVPHSPHWPVELKTMGRFKEGTSIDESETDESDMPEMIEMHEIAAEGVARDIVEEAIQRVEDEKIRRAEAASEAGKRDAAEARVEARVVASAEKPEAEAPPKRETLRVDSAVVVDEDDDDDEEKFDFGVVVIEEKTEVLSPDVSDDEDDVQTKFDAKSLDAVVASCLLREHSTLQQQQEEDTSLAVSAPLPPPPPPAEEKVALRVHEEKKANVQTIYHDLKKRLQENDRLLAKLHERSAQVILRSSTTSSS